MAVRIFDMVEFKGQTAQVVYVDDSTAQIKVDNQIFWISREDLESLHRKEDNGKSDSL